jgi:2'-5' RNA ligase
MDQKMNEIGDLFGGGNKGSKRDPTSEHERRPPGEVFFAINPDGDGADAAVGIARSLSVEQRLTGKPLTPDRLHVTLLAIGRYPELQQEVVEAACDVVAGLAVRPFEVMFNRAMSYPTGRSTRPLALVGGDGTIEVEMFQRTLFAEMKRIGLPVGRPPKPHMTLLYDRRAVTEQPVTPVRWPVREFVLIHSLSGQSRHVPLARWPLRG